MKTQLKLLALFAIVIIVGHSLWPFLVWLLNIHVRYALLIWGIICLLLWIIGILRLIISYIKKQDKRQALWIIAWGGAIAISGWLFSFYDTKGKYGGSLIHSNGSKYHDDYIKIESKQGMGLMDKFGFTFIPATHEDVFKIFNEKNFSYQFVGIKARDYSDEEEGYRTVKLYIYNIDGELREILDVTKDSDCNNTKEYIEKHLGEIMLNYDNYNSEPPEYRIVRDDIKAINEPNRKAYEHNRKMIEKMYGEKKEEDDKGVKEIVVRHVREKQQVWKERWRPCISCDRGKCRQCHGQGGYYIGNIYNVCTSCNGTGACVWCGGRGEIMETYSTWE